MIDQARQRRKLFETRPVWAVVQVLLMPRGFKVLVETRQVPEQGVTKVALVLPVPRVPGELCRLVGSRAMPFEKLV